MRFYFKQYITFTRSCIEKLITSVIRETTLRIVKRRNYSVSIIKLSIALHKAAFLCFNITNYKIKEICMYYTEYIRMNKRVGGNSLLKK